MEEVEVNPAKRELEEEKLKPLEEGKLEPCAKKSKLDDNTSNGTVNIESNVKENNLLNETEEKYGLKYFVNKNSRFSGIIKQRYSDFNVRECDVDGNLIYLTDFDHCDDAYKNIQSDVTECPIDDEVLVNKIKEFVKSDDKTKTFTLDADNDKEHRKDVHKYIKDSYKDIETNTELLDNGSSAIILSFKSNKNTIKRQQRKPGWPKHIPKYCHFVLFKENRDTMECINLIAKLLYVKASTFGYSGTKDRRATTVQKVSVQNVYSKQLKNLNNRLQNIKVGNFSYKDKGLTLGDLSGNDFTIIIRDVSGSDEQIHACCNSLKENGFINYFGLQRFGTGSIATHTIGKVLLEGKFEEAINLILHYSETEEDCNRFESSAKKIWQQTCNAKKAFAAIRNKSCIEGKLLEQLSKQTGISYNYYNAFTALPRNNRLLYIHSYQSIVWNNMVSKRIEAFGFKPCIGDLIVRNEKDENGYQMVSTLNETDIDVKTFSIYDIVLPLPGYDMVYPSNTIGKYYRDFLASDGLDIDNMKRNNKEFSLSGKYRQMVVKPKDMSWQIHAYDDYTISLIQTDYEKLLALKSDEKKSIDDSCPQSGQHKAIKLQITLPPSTYATTALREVLVADSSYRAQNTLNERFKSKSEVKLE